jgi:serine/threonine protein kinase
LQNLLRGVHIERAIGEGHFGKVFLATRQGVRVAVKQITAGAGSAGSAAADSASEASFLKELDAMVGLSSPRVVQLFGVCVLPREHGGGGGMGLVMEYCALGSLDGHLQAHEQSLTGAALLAISVHIAEGLAYLHSPGVGILHRDVAARNVLVAGDGSCKLADFGLARRVAAGATYVATSALPVRWSAPEVLSAGHTASQASDVYALAMTLVEVFDGGRVPFSLELATNLEVVDAVVARGVRPARPRRMPAAVHALVARMWDASASARPTAAAVVEALLLQQQHAATLGTGAEETPASPDAVVYARFFVDPESVTYQG